MSALSEAAIRETLSTVKYPGFSRDIVSFGLVKEVKLTGSDVLVQLALTTGDPRVAQTIKDDSERALRAVTGIGTVTVRIDIHAPAQTPPAARAPSRP